MVVLVVVVVVVSVSMSVPVIMVVVVMMRLGVPPTCGLLVVHWLCLILGLGNGDITWCQLRFGSEVLIIYRVWDSNRTSWLCPQSCQKCIQFPLS